MTTDNPITPGLICDITGALERHGYFRSDDQHADRAIGILGDMARIYEGTQHHPFGPYLKEPPLRTEPAPPRPAAQDSVVLPASEVRAVIAALGEASVYKRNRVEMGGDCAGQSCGSCQRRLQAAGTYDLLTAQLDNAAQAWRSATANHPAAASQLQPVAGKEAGQ